MRLLRLVVAVLLASAALAVPAGAATPTATITVTSTAPVYPSDITVSGRVRHVATGTRTVLQEAHGYGWKNVRAIKTTSGGRWSTSYVATVDQGRLRLVVPAAKSRRRAASQPVTVSAQPRILPTAAVRNRPIEVSGRLSSPVKRPVELQITTAGSTHSVEALTSSSGTFTFKTALSTAATLRVVAVRKKVGSRTYPEVLTSRKSITVTDAPLTSTPSPTVIGSPRFGSVLSVGQPAWDTGAVLTYQWLRNGVPVTGATGTSYAVGLADIGHPLSVRVTGSKPGFASATRTSATTGVVTPAVLTAPLPTLEGVLAPGETVRAAPGAWTPGATLSYAWEVDGEPVAGATGETFTIRVLDVGKRLRVTVTGAKPGYATASAPSSSSAPVARDVLHLTPQPRVTGEPEVGSILTAVTGTWDAGVSLTCQWLRDGAEIPGETDCEHLVTDADAGARLAVQVSGAKPGSATASRSSEQTDIVSGGALVRTPVPTVSGDPAVDEQLVVSPGAWDAGTSLTYEWRRDGTAIPDAHGTTYALVGDDAGHRITVTVTGAKPGFVPVARTSTATGTIARGTLTSAEPLVEGLAQLGGTLTVTPGAWGPGEVDLAYRWTRDEVTIPGATSSTYTLTEADQGSLLAVEVTGSRTGYVSRSRLSGRQAVSDPQSASKVARALRTFHAALDDVDDEPLDIFVGPSDSLADGARATSIQRRWISVLRDDLRAVHQPAGVPGGFGYLDPYNWGVFPDNPISYEKGAGVFDQGFGRQSLALFDATQSITLEDRFTDVDIFYSGQSGVAGAFTYSVDGAPAKRVSTGGKPKTRGGYVERISGLGAGRHTVVMRGAGGGQGTPAIVEGVMLYSGDRQHGVRVWEAGASARRALDYVAPTDAWATSLAEVHPDLVVVPIGSNDYALGVSAAETEGRIREIIATIRSHVDTDPSIVLMPYYDRPTGGTETWAAYEQMYARIASTDPDIAVFDLEPLFGPYRGDRRNGLMAADLIHPSDEGYALIARKFTEFLTGADTP